jgi:hypothetical protein
MIGALSPSTPSLIGGLYPTATSRVRRDDARERQDRPDERRLERQQPVEKPKQPTEQPQQNQKQPAEKEEEQQDPTAPKGADGKPLTADEQAQIRKLQERDREVRAHEAAHKAAGGGLAGGASFSYQQGPDGRYYAVGGEVSIDMGSERDPQATIAKMRRVIAAALAPGDPSPQDMAVAAAAQQAMAEAQRQLNQRKQDEGGKPDQTADRPQQQAKRAYGAGSQQQAPAGSQLSLIA